MIPVAKSFIPNIDEYIFHLQKAFDDSWLTNRGKLVIELEEKLRSHLNVENLIMTNNGTIPLQIALKLLGGKGDVITTPFSYVATTSSIVWENLKPVFVDIDPVYWTIDPSKIENSITDKTTSILVTHVFGNPCDIESIEEIAKRNNLNVIYDAAHCFGVNYKGKSVFDYGEISTCSFHATKLFHTGEGGALFTNNEDLLKRAYYSHNFGHDGPLAFHGLGINAKISELQAAMGLAVLPHIDEIISDRKQIVERYLSMLDLKKIQTISIRPETDWNYSYFPVVFDSEETLLEVEKTLNNFKIFPRRYFYPSLNTLPYVEHTIMPVAESISKRILCLPLYVGLKEKELISICELINKVI